MFRLRIAITLLILLSCVLGLAAAFHWGMQQAEYHFQRSHVARDVWKAYSQTSLHAYQHFQERLDGVLFDGAHQADDDTTGRRLQASLADLRAATRREVEHLDDEEEIRLERAEWETVEEFERLILSILNTFDQARRLRDEGRIDEMRALLATLLLETINKRFYSLVESGMSEERAEAMAAEQAALDATRRIRVFGAWTAVGAALFAAVMGVGLWRSVSIPIASLISGTRKIASGDLNHRIRLHGKNEFTSVADSFNLMADELQKHRGELLEAQAGLEEKVAHRTAQLSEANSELQRVDKVRRQLLADISHELRTPLTVIRGEAEVTLRGNGRDGSDYAAALRRIVDLTGDLAKLVDDVLFISREELVGVRFNMHPLVLNELFADAADDARALAHRKQIEVKLELPDQELAVLGDRERLKQLLLILVDNACRYSHPRGVVTMMLQRSGERARMTVADEGIGIREEDQTAIFERFYRGEHARRFAPGGAGIGLSIARSIVVAHDGHITLQSAPAAGTLVAVELPLLPRMKSDGHLAG